MTRTIERRQEDQKLHQNHSATVQDFSFDVFKCLSEFLTPSYFIAGMLISFAACCAFGFYSTSYNVFKDFHRFHPFISPDSLFYPTIAQLRSLVLSKSQDNQILVIVGGNSIFNGVGQPEHQLWTTKLQELLGSRFAVVNLAFRGAFPFEAAYICAESLFRENRKVLYATITAPGICGKPEGSTYGYLYWDAISQGLLMDYPTRSADVSHRQSNPTAARLDLNELWLRSVLNDKLHFCDGWTNIGYRRFFTVWNALTSSKFLMARRTFQDPEGEPPPLPQRFGNVEIEKKICQGFSLHFFDRTKDQGWKPANETWAALEQEFECITPPAIRKSCLVVLPRNCGAYRQLLSEQDQQRDNLMYQEAVRRWQQHGYCALEFGDTLQYEDYCDRTHLAPSGGHKLATQLSIELKRLAAARGYL